MSLFTYISLLSATVLRTVIVCSIVVFPLSAEEKILSPAEAKVHYTVELIKQIKWPNEQEFSIFTIGILGDDKELLQAFEQRIFTPIRGKSLKFTSVSPTDVQSGHYSIVLITNKSRHLNAQIFSEVTDSLILTDGKVSKEQQMISLISTNRDIQISFNRENLSTRNFDISTNLLDFAGTKEDLTEQMKEDEKRLRELLINVAEKEASLNSLETAMSEKTKLLERAQIKLQNNIEILANNNLQLDTLAKDIERAKQAVATNKRDLAEQQKHLQQKQAELTAKEQAIEALQASINTNQKTLDEQLSKILRQSVIIEKRDQTIDTQKDWLIINLIITAVFFTMIYALLRLNRLRKKANAELGQLNSQLYEQATTDGMTGLFNRRHFLETTQRELSHQQRKQLQSVMLMIDIDFFKSVNDTYGHAAGDEVIKKVAGILKVNSRKYDVVGRLGGEEFAMLLLDCDMAVAIDISKRLCKDCAGTTFVFQDSKINITISIGLAQFFSQDTKTEQVINRADKALYRAKQNGRNQVVVFDDQIEH